MFQFNSTPALIVVDMQNGFCHKDGSFARLGIQTSPTTVVARINELLSEFRATSLPIYFLKTGYKAGYSDRRGRDRQDRLEQFQGLLQESWDADILDELMPGPDDNVINKTRNSCVLCTSLENILKERGVDYVILTGVGTDVFVETTARDAYQLNFAVTTISDATGTYNKSDHLAALHALRNFSSTASISEVIKALKKLRNL
jgi:nicotinamidase-related amidase